MTLGCKLHLWVIWEIHTQHLVAKAMELGMELGMDPNTKT
jgi:hypothetical protein